VSSPTTAEFAIALGRPAGRLDNWLSLCYIEIGAQVGQAIAAAPLEEPSRKVRAPQSTVLGNTQAG